jgi:hypothetical protein
VNGTGEADRLPHSVGGLLGFALSGSATPLNAALTLGVFAAYAAAEYAIAPGAVLDSPQGEFKKYVLTFTGLFADAFVVAAVALRIAARAHGVAVAPSALLGGAVERWLPVIVVTFLAQAVVIVTAPLSGLVRLPGPDAFMLVAAPIVWMLWGVVGLAGPYVALSSDRAALLVVTGFGRAFALALHRTNLVRLAVLALVTVLPSLLQMLLYDELLHDHTQRTFFWSNAPVDALTIVPLCAIQTAFALDFARRAGAFDQR